MTKDGQFSMPSEEQNCHALVTVTGDDVTNSVKVIPRLETLVSHVTHDRLSLLIRNGTIVASPPGE